MLGMFAITISQFLFYMPKIIFNLVMHFKCAVKCRGRGSIAGAYLMLSEGKLGRPASVPWSVGS